MILHCVSLENENPLDTYEIIRSELEKFDSELLKKDEWILLTKSDLCTEESVRAVVDSFTRQGFKNMHVVSAETNTGVKELSDALVKHLRSKNI